MIVRDSNPIVIVGNSELGPEDLNTVLKHAPIVVAADGGADHLLTTDVLPAAVIGDLDSISEEGRHRYREILHRIDEQDTTDFEKALSRIDTPLIIGVGFLGGRLDHTFATLNVVARNPQKNVVLLGADDVVCVLSDRSFEIELPVGTDFSVLPLSDSKVSSQGLRWELEQSDLSMTGLVSSSNQTQTDIVCIRVEGAIAITLPRDELPAAIRAVRGE